VNQNAETRKTYAATDPTVGTLNVDDYIIYEWAPRDVVLPNRVTCEQWWNNTYNPNAFCASARDASWMNMRLVSNVPPQWLFRLYGFRQPHYTVNGGIQLVEYHVRAHRIVGIYNHNYQNVARDIYVVMQTPSNTNDANIEFKYQIGVFMATDIV
jgi:hypothetical protein